MDNQAHDVQPPGSFDQTIAAGAQAPQPEDLASSKEKTRSASPPGNVHSEDYAPYHFPNFGRESIASPAISSCDLHQETLTLSIELGRQRLDSHAISELQQGSQIILQQLAQEPVGLYVKQQHVGQGELLIRHNKLCIRITHLLSDALKRSA